MPDYPEKELSDLERLLESLTPRPASLERDRLFFRAGQACVRQSYAWPLATLAVSALASILAFVVLVRPTPEPIIRIVQVPVPMPAPMPVPDDPEQPGVPDHPRLDQPSTPQPRFDSLRSPGLSAWQLQQEALRFGVEQLPSSLTSGGGAPGDGVPLLPRVGEEL